MKNKRNGIRMAGRALALTLCGALLCGAFTGCRSNRPKDGTYTARYQYPSGGYVEYLTVTFRDGRAAEVEFDAYAEADPGKKKSQTSKEEYPMNPHPSEWMDDLEDNIEDAGLKADKINTVAGATSSSQHARELYHAILTAAKDGRTDEIIVENEADAQSGNSAAGTESSSDDGLGEILPDDGNGPADGEGVIPGESGSMAEENSATDGTASDGAATGDSSAADGSGMMSENAGTENASGGNGTGTGESSSENTVSGESASGSSK